MDEFKNRYVHSLARLPGVTEEIALALYEAGYTDKQKVFAADDADLKKVKGITTAKLNGLKAYRYTVEAASKAEKWEGKK
jgi:ERCC4-type nuclease